MTEEKENEIIPPTRTISHSSNNIRAYKQKVARANNIIAHLRDTLSNLHYSTYQCVNCKWVDHEDNQWYGCVKCDEYICETCYNEREDELVICGGCL